MVWMSLTAGLLVWTMGEPPSPVSQGDHWSRADTVLVTGAVREAETGRPIAGAWVAVGETGPGAFSDDLGNFAVRVAEGTYEVMVGQLGYATRAVEITVRSGNLIRMEIELATEALELDPIVVEVRSQALLRAGYYDRLTGGLTGTRITRHRIEEEQPRVFSDLFYSVPGVRVLLDANGRAQLRSRRGGGGGYGCETTLYIDGFAVTERMHLRTNQPQLTDVNILSPNTIEAVEVYVGAATPPQYPSRCGVVLVWTRN
ncbi:MAG: TonB-dependent receptor [Gemmatimonadota bacterium]